MISHVKVEVNAHLPLDWAKICHRLPTLGSTTKIETDKATAAVLDPEQWAEESADLAQKFGYANPVSPGKNAVMLTREYETNAHNLAKTQLPWRHSVLPMS